MGRDLGQISQPQAPAELRFISQSPSAAYPDPDNWGFYDYDVSAGQNAIIYVLDAESFDLSLPVSRFIFRFCLKICSSIGFVMLGRRYRMRRQLFCNGFE